ncbi:hypothetical protein [uncultured Parabacteroides sp.]|uniref:hypothetical protein n=1 Tax=uncultured Parabacteroides sp. TaxID=512312 RepID=UPI0025F571EF|nr:hypothetical protein [uncultured Parabacteroides sp.]
MQHASMKTKKNNPACGMRAQNRKKTTRHAACEHKNRKKQPGTRHASIKTKKNTSARGMRARNEYK